MFTHVVMLTLISRITLRRVSVRIGRGHDLELDAAVVATPRVRVVRVDRDQALGADATGRDAVLSRSGGAASVAPGAHSTDEPAVYEECTRHRGMLHVLGLETNARSETFVDRWAGAPRMWLGAYSGETRRAAGRP